MNDLKQNGKGQERKIKNGNGKERERERSGTRTGTVRNGNGNKNENGMVTGTVQERKNYSKLRHGTETNSTKLA